MLQPALPNKLSIPGRSASLPKFLPKLPPIRIASKLRYNLSKEYHKNLTQELLETLKEQQKIRNIKEKERNSIYEIDAQKKKLKKNLTDSRSCVQLNKRNRSVLNLDPRRDELNKINIPLYEYSLVGKSYSSLTSSSSDLKNDYKLKMPIFALQEISDDAEQFPHIHTRSITNCKIRNPKMGVFKHEPVSVLHDLAAINEVSKSNYLHNHIKTLQINHPNPRSRLKKLIASKNSTISQYQSELSPQLVSALSVPATPLKLTAATPNRPNLRIDTKKHLEESDVDSSPLCPFRHSDEVEFNPLHDLTDIN